MSEEKIPTTVEELRELVDAHEGVLTTRMGVLRDAYGKDRLGIHVVAGIESGLAGCGLGHFPLSLPNDHWQPIRIYRRGTPVGNLIDAVLDLNTKRDEELVRVCGGSDAATLQQIRELVCP